MGEAGDPPITHGGSTPSQGLPPAVAALRGEIEERRAAAVERAVVEQAKGVLVERFGITLDDAAQRLRLIASEDGLPLGAAARSVLGGPASPPGRGANDRPAVDDERLARRPEDGSVLRSPLRIDLAGEGEEAARLVLELARPLDAVGALLYRLAADGSLRMLGAAGIVVAVSSSWSSIPPGVEVPLTRAVATDRAVFLGSRRERDTLFPVLAGLSSGAEASASVPVRHAGEVIGVIGFVWDRPTEMDDELRARVTRVVDLAGPVLLRSVGRGAPDLGAVAEVLPVLTDPWVLLQPRHGGRGEILDLRVGLASGDVPGAEAGRWVSEVWPGLTTSWMFERLVWVARHGGVVERTVTAAADVVAPLTGLSRVRLARLGGDLVIHWRAVAAPRRAGRSRA